MNVPHTSQAYLQGFEKEVENGHAIRNAFLNKKGTPTRIWYQGSQSLNPIDLVASVNRNIDAKIESVCVIENIDSRWIGEIGHAWGIERDFFLQYAAFPSSDLRSLREALEAVNGSAWDEWDARKEKRFPPPAITKRYHFHIAGIVPFVDGNQSHARYERPLQVEGSSMTCGLCMSYYRVKGFFYLFLVDPPLNAGTFEGVLTEKFELRPSTPSFWVPFVRNPKGLPIPQAFDEREPKRLQLSLFTLVTSFITTIPYFELLFASDSTMGPGVFSHFLAQSSSKGKLEYLNAKIKAFSFGQLRSGGSSDGKIKDLIELQYDVDTLRAGARHAATYVPPSISTYSWLYKRRGFKTEYDDIVARANELEGSIVDASQLFLSVLGAEESIENMKLTQQSTKLTLLATIYLPLSVATGIFGMNIREINDSSLPLWVFIVTLIILIVITVALFSISVTKKPRRALLKFKYFQRKVSQVDENMSKDKNHNPQSV